jgi:hypothetical protein
MGLHGPERQTFPYLDEKCVVGKEVVAWSYLVRIWNKQWVCKDMCCCHKNAYLCIGRCVGIHIIAIQMHVHIQQKWTNATEQSCSWEWWQFLSTQLSVIIQTVFAFIKCCTPSSGANNIKKLQAGLVLLNFFLCDFVLMWLENLHHFSNLRSNFQFNMMYLVIQSFCSSTVSINTYVWLGISLFPKTNVSYVHSGHVLYPKLCNCFVDIWNVK